MATDTRSRTLAMFGVLLRTLGNVYSEYNNAVTTEVQDSEILDIFYRACQSVEKVSEIIKKQFDEESNIIVVEDEKIVLDEAMFKTAVTSEFIAKKFELYNKAEKLFEECLLRTVTLNDLAKFSAYSRLYSELKKKYPNLSQVMRFFNYETQMAIVTAVIRKLLKRPFERHMVWYKKRGHFSLLRNTFKIILHKNDVLYVKFATVKDLPLDEVYKIVILPTKVEKTFRIEFFV